MEEPKEEQESMETTETASEAAKSASGAKKWYVVHTYSGYEHKAKAALEERVRAMHMEHKVGAVLVPVERVQELGKGGQRKISSRKFFPGYIFVNMVLDALIGTWRGEREQRMRASA